MKLSCNGTKSRGNGAAITELLSGANIVRTQAHKLFRDSDRLHRRINRIHHAADCLHRKIEVVHSKVRTYRSRNRIAGRRTNHR
jgi:hypothetical protein